MTPTDDWEEQRRHSLGTPHVLVDQFIGQHILPLLDDIDMIHLGACSRWWYALTHQEDHWRQRFLEHVVLARSDAKSNHHSPEETEKQSSGKKGKAIKEITLYDGSWFSTAIRWMRGDTPPPTMLNTSLFQATSYRRFDGAPGECWPLYIPAVRSWYLFAKWALCHTPMNTFDQVLAPSHLKVDVIEPVSFDKFQREYNATCTPVLINGLAANWSANQHWKIDQLLEKFGDREVCVSIENEGPRPERLGRFYIRLQDYIHYCKLEQDTSPLYIFDAGFGKRIPEMLTDYQVPEYFQQDFFSLLDKKHRPPFRWFVMGPARTGASWHIDPHGTSAWNTLIVGRKRWALYPGHISPPGVEESDDNNIRGPDSLFWYREIYPTLPPEQRPLECIQEPGQTIFVPGGWWHMVLNLEDTVAVTQNFADEHNLDLVCSDISDDPPMLTALIQAVSQAHPHLTSFLEKYLPKTTSDPIVLDEGYQSRDGFTKSFEDLNVWRPRCEEVLRRHDLLPQTEWHIEALTTGQNPVFLIDDHFIVKFYTHLVSGYHAFNMETSTLSALSQHDDRFPTTLAHGHLRCPKSCTHTTDQQPPWHWPYVIMTKRSGQPLQQLLDVEQQHLVDWHYFVPWLAETTAVLHQTQITSTQPDPSAFRQFLLKQAHKCYDRHQRWRHLPSWLIEDIPNYLQPFIRWLQTGQSPRTLHTKPDVTLTRIDRLLSRAPLLHGDLHAVNVLGNCTPHWQPHALVDFADAMHHGDPLWDLVPVYISMLNGDKHHFRRFLHLYRQRVPKYFANDVCISSYKTSPIHLLLRPHYPFPFAYVMMCYTLLWPFEGLVRWMTIEQSELCTCRYLKSMEKRLWGSL